MQSLSSQGQIAASWASSSGSGMGLAGVLNNGTISPNASPVMTLMDRPRGFSLWISDVLPNPNAKWSLLDTHADRGVLERRKQSLLTLAASRRYAILEGTEPPYWKPML